VPNAVLIAAQTRTLLLLRSISVKASKSVCASTTDFLHAAACDGEYQPYAEPDACATDRKIVYFRSTQKKPPQNPNPSPLTSLSRNSISIKYQPILMC